MVSSANFILDCERAEFCVSLIYISLIYNSIQYHLVQFQFPSFQYRSFPQYRNTKKNIDWFHCFYRKLLGSSRNPRFFSESRNFRPDHFWKNYQAYNRSKGWHLSALWRDPAIPWSSLGSRCCESRGVSGTLEMCPWNFSFKIDSSAVSPGRGQWVNP